MKLGWPGGSDIPPAGGARSSDLARVQRVSRQAVSAVLHDLETQRYLRRRDDENNGRGIVYVPTARGRRVLADYVGGIGELEGRYSSILGTRRFQEMALAARDLAHLLTLPSCCGGWGRPRPRGSPAIAGSR